MPTVVSPNTYLVPQAPRSQRLYSRNLHNRLRAVMTHTISYAFKGEARLAEDTGVSRSSINRLINGQTNPSFALVCTLAQALSTELGRRIEPCELISCDGTYPTRFVCALCGCKGCLPNQAYDDEESRRPEYAHIQPGQWSTEDFPALAESEVE